MATEQLIAILMADLSGYTALTETHGARLAADLIDKYISIAEQCLVGKSRLHERTGDEIMIVSPCADDLFATAVMISNHVAKEEHFLQVHGGLHTGVVLNRNNHFFGSTVNLAARITAKAVAGRFWCSAPFARMLRPAYSEKLVSQGHHSFKNIADKTELFQLSAENKNQFYIDPVCRMLILDTEKAFTNANHPGVYYCSAYCSETSLINQQKITL